MSVSLVTCGFDLAKISSSHGRIWWFSNFVVILNHNLGRVVALYSTFSLSWTKGY